MSRIESDADPVAENIEEEETEEIADVPDIAESIGTEHTQAIHDKMKVHVANVTLLQAQLSNYRKKSVG